MIAISRTLVGLLGGTLEVASTPGEGSRFWFDLELSEAATVQRLDELESVAEFDRRLTLQAVARADLADGDRRVSHRWVSVRRRPLVLGGVVGRQDQNSRGLANKAAMLLQESGIRPEQLPRLKQLFEQAYPTVKRYTPIALATHCTEFAAAL